MGSLKLGSPGVVALSESSGTISIDSGVAFPAGHAIQTNYYKFDTDNSNALGTNTPTIFTQNGTSTKAYKATISGLTSGNDVLVVMCFPCYCYRASKLAGTSFHIFRDSEGTPVYNNNASSGNKRALFQYTEGTVSEVVAASQITLIYLDESPTATSHTYYLGASSTNSATTTLYTKHDDAAGPFTSIIQEIQK